MAIQLSVLDHMKTTIQIPDSLFEEARCIAQRENTTLKSLVEEGLRRIVSERKEPKPFRLRDASFGGQGLQPDIAGGSWETICGLIYERRCGGSPAPPPGTGG